MPFMITARDLPDAFERRMSARAEHLAQMEKMKQAGQALFAAASVDDNGRLVASTIIVDMPDRAAVDAYLQQEAYVVQNVWDMATLTITPCRVPELFK